VFDPDVIADATFAMQHVIRDGTGTWARRLGRPVAGKTGTATNNFAASFAGFSPGASSEGSDGDAGAGAKGRASLLPNGLSTVVAMYRISDDGKKSLPLEAWGPFEEITGGSYPVRVWTSFMREALDGTPEKDFPEPVFGGEEINPKPVPTVEPSPEPEPEPEPSPEPSQPQPSPSPSPEPSQPTPEPTLPTPDPTIQPTPTPSASPGRTPFPRRSPRQPR
jgi:membrane peptidoglycan carboxypeptidase